MEKTLLKEIVNAGFYMSEKQKPVVYNEHKKQFETEQGIRISTITNDMEFHSSVDEVCKYIGALLVGFTDDFDEILRHKETKFFIEPRKTTNKENKSCPLCDGVKRHIEKHPHDNVIAVTFRNGELKCKNYAFNGTMEELADFVSKTGEFLLTTATRKMNAKEIKKFNKMLNI